MCDKPNQPVQLNRTPETSAPRGISLFPTEKGFPACGFWFSHAGKAISCVGFHFSRMGKAISYEGFCFSYRGKVISCEGFHYSHTGKAISCEGFHFSCMGKAISYEGFCFSLTGKAFRAPSAMCRHVDDAWRAPDRVLSVDHYSLGGLHLRFPNDGLILSDKRFQPVRFLLLPRCDQNILFRTIELRQSVHQTNEYCLRAACAGSGDQLRINSDSQAHACSTFIIGIFTS